MTISAALRYGYVAAAIAWAAAVPLAAVAIAWPAARHAEFAFVFAVYSIGSLVCHQIPARSFQLWSIPLPVCARCTGIYAGAALGAVVALGRRFESDGAVDRPGARTRAHRERAALLASAALIAATLAYEWITGHAPGNAVRALSGLPLGVVVSAIVVHAAEERVEPRLEIKVN